MRIWLEERYFVLLYRFVYGSGRTSGLPVRLFPIRDSVHALAFCKFFSQRDFGLVFFQV